MVPLLTSLKLTNLLSFGPNAVEIPLRPLNVIIGLNGSGKSNFLEAIDLLQNAPTKITKPILQGGGIQDWIWKGKRTPESLDTLIEAVVDASRVRMPPYTGGLRYVLAFAPTGQSFTILDEQIEAKNPKPGESTPYLYYSYHGGAPILNVKGTTRKLQRESIDETLSILAQRRDPEQYPEITSLAQDFSRIMLYREWSFGRHTPPRMPQKPDMMNDYLEADSSNLGLVLNRLCQYPEVKKRLLDALKVLYEGIEDFGVSIESNSVQVYFHEKGLPHRIPATRLSDGTLRYLCLLAILCNPSPPPLVCIEEPELGLHPDVLPTLAALLQEASQRGQLIVTTHSDVLVDALTETPEDVLICEKDSVTGTTLRRLNAQELDPWLKQYRLGELWTRGDIGGTRW